MTTRRAVGTRKKSCVLEMTSQSAAQLAAAHIGRAITALQHRTRQHGTAMSTKTNRISDYCMSLIRHEENCKDCSA